MRITWAEKVGRPECYYLRRWVVGCRFFSIRLHHWLESDDQRNFHDHAWWFVTMVLKGSYVDKSQAGNELMRRGRIRFRPAHHAHTVLVAPGGCWTLIITGPVIRKWGFWVNGKFKKANKYFLEHGHHQCEGIQ